MAVRQTVKGVQILVSIFLVALTIIVMFNANLGILQWTTNYGVQIMLGMLALGFVFYIFGAEGLMFVSLICCALLCLFLQKSANVNLVLPQYTKGSTFKIAHANLTNITGDIDEALLRIARSEADVVSLQEVNFPLMEKVNNFFNAYYPNITSLMKENDFWSVYVMSKNPMIELDTFYFNGIPNLHGGIVLDGEEHPIYFISTYTLPPFSDQQESEVFRNHLAEVSNAKRNNEKPYVVFGDFNVAGWYDEIQDFREEAGLMDSRRGYMPAVNNPFGYPVDHIFFSNQLVCVGFEIIKNEDSEHVGILGTYQLKEKIINEN